MAIVEFSAGDMKIIMLANERVIFALKLTDSDVHMLVKARISALIMECAENGERDLQKLVDCAHTGLTQEDQL